MYEIRFECQLLLPFRLVTERYSAAAQYVLGYMFPEASVASTCMESGIGPGLQTSQQALPMEHALRICKRIAKTDGIFHDLMSSLDLPSDACSIIGNVAF